MRRVVIAGAGIGGLTAALALAARGFQITLLEKADRLEDVGAGLQLSPNASGVLLRLGLGPRLAPHVIAPDHLSIMTARSGGDVVRLPLGVKASSEAPYWLLHRADLQRALLDAVGSQPNIELRLGAPVDVVEADADIVRVGGVEASALIGADGAWSAVRGQLFPDRQPRFSGLIAWRGTCPAENLPPSLRPAGVQLWMGPQAHLVAYPMSAGTTVNLVAILPGPELAPGWTEPGRAAEIERHFSQARWPDHARAMIAAVDNWQRWPLTPMPDGGAWHRGRVALIGDAAHAMMPFVAQGAGMAIEDAAVLARCLGSTAGNSGDLGDGETPGDGDIPAALARYAALRAPRVTRVQRAARQSGRIYHLRGPLALARDVTMRLLGPERLQARHGWIYDWRP